MAEIILYGTQWCGYSRRAKALLQVAVRVKDVLAAPLFADGRLVAGQAGVNRSVRWVTVMEWPVEEFVRSGELVLTSGIGCDDEMFVQFVREIIGSGAAALFVGVGPGRYVESIQDEVRRLAEEQSFPLVEIAWELRFGDIIRQIVDLILADQYRALDTSDAIHHKFTSIVLDGLGCDAVADALERLIERPVLILDRDLRLLGSGRHAQSVSPGLLREFNDASNRLTSDEFAATTRLLRSRTPQQVPPLPPLGLGPTFSMAVLAAREIAGYLLAFDDGSREHMPALDARAMEHAALAAAMDLLRLQAAAAADDRARGHFLWRLAEGRAGSANEIRESAALLGHDLRSRYHVLVVAPESHASGTDAASSFEDIERWLQRAARHAGTTVATARGDAMLLVLIEAVAGRDDVAKLVADSLQQSRLESGDRPPSIGVGGARRKLTNLDEGYSEAKRALDVGRVILGPGCLAESEKLAPYLILSGIAQDDEARRIVSSVLEPLLEYDGRTSRELVHTLGVFLDEGCNTSSAARRLYLNRHSLLYRLRKIESLTGRSLGSANDRFVLDLSLKLHAFGLALDRETT